MCIQHSAGKPSPAEEVSRLTARQAAGRFNIREEHRKTHIAELHIPLASVHYIANI